MIDFLSGAVVLAYLVGAAFFLRFWRRTADRFFVWFALAFAMLAVHHWVTFSFEVISESNGFYALRVLAYAIILCAIVDKNLSSRRG
jgi:hypothetical protein